MSTADTIARPLAAAAVSTHTSRVLWIAGAIVFAAIAYYFVGIDQGLVSVFGNESPVHELMHDGRHLLGFPCH